LGVSLADVVAQIRAWYASEGRPAPRFSETLLSAYESGQKRPGPEYLHYLCAVYRTEPSDLGYHGHCFCGRPHRAVPPARPVGPGPAPAAAPNGDRTGPSDAGLMRGRPAVARSNPQGGPRSPARSRGGGGGRGGAAQGPGANDRGRGGGSRQPVPRRGGPHPAPEG